MCTIEQTFAVSVVLPVLDEEHDIGRLLSEVLQQTPPAGGFEVLVVDGGSHDKTRDIVTALVASHANLRLLKNPRKLSSASRNVGANAARGRYVLYLDGHCAIPRNDYLVRLVELFESTGAACLCRPQPLNRLKDGAWTTVISAARHSWLGHNPGSDIYGGSPGLTDPHSAGAAYQRSVIEELGGYDERFDACEDVEFNHRVAAAGLASYRHPDLAVEYRPRSSLRALFRQMFRYGRGRARLMARHPNAIAWPLLLATVCMLLLFASIFAAGATRPGILVIALVASWGSAVIFEATRMFGFSVNAGRAALAFLAIHSGLLAGFWRGLMEFQRFHKTIPPGA